MPLFSKFKRQFQKSKDSSTSTTFSVDSSSECSPSLISSPTTSYLAVPPYIESSTYKVYIKYDVATPPPRPVGENWTRFVCISDTCGEAFPVPSGDVLLHAGNLTSGGKLHEFKNTVDWLGSLDHALKILVAGSNDAGLQRSFNETNGFVTSMAEKEDYEAIINLLKGSRARKAGIVYLEDTAFEFKLRENSRMWRVFGFPWVVKWERNRAFAYLPFPLAEEHVARIPTTDILLSHGPSNGILDATTRDGLSGLHVGCLTLLQHMQRIRPYLHVFGHVFEGHGAEIRVHDPNGVHETVEINATMLPNNGGGNNSSSSLLNRTSADMLWSPIIVDVYDVEY